MAYFEKREHAPVNLGSSPVPGLYRHVAKRWLDVFVVALIAFPTLIVVAIAAALVSLDGKSPIYTQRRVGKAGREFNILKLRSMVVNADALLEEHLKNDSDARAEWDEKQKLRHDPRITPVGHFIRKTSLDELPQIWNVFKGEMSLVGPRPIMPSQRGIYPGRAYYEMRPGITGLWQVSERNEASFAQRAFYDNQYHSDMSFGCDLSMMLKTVSVVIRANGQ